jgi:YD repeat-containing protein
VQYTQYYNLKKPDPNDTYNKQHDNDNMDIIDGQLHENAQAVANALAAANSAVPQSAVGQPGGVASLDPTGKVPLNQLPVTNIASLGSKNTDVDFFTALIQRADTRGNSYIYDAVTGNLLQVAEIDPATNTTIKTINYTYDSSGNLIQMQELIGGKTITTTYSYDPTTGNLTGTGRSVQ